MAERIRVAVYGSTRNIGEIVAELKTVPDFEVFSLDPISSDTRRFLRDYRPQVIVFDLSEPSSGMYISLLRSSPGLRMIGLDLENKTLQDFSSGTTQVVRLQNLVDLIRSKITNKDSRDAENFQNKRSIY